MADITVKRIEEFDTPNGGGFCRARASLGVTSFGMQVENFPPHFEHHPSHDHTDDGQEEVYTALAGSATVHAGGSEYRLEPGVFIRIGPGEIRQVTTGDEGVQLLAIGAVPGRPYAAPSFTEEGASLPG
jgi:mannose-6-phosphate isomerase-like protein (cupin superfamily)